MGRLGHLIYIRASPVLPVLITQSKLKSVLITIFCFGSSKKKSPLDWLQLCFFFLEHQSLCLKSFLTQAIYFCAFLKNNHKSTVHMVHF